MKWALKVRGAASIMPGCANHDLATWPGTETKPQKPHLIAAVLARDSPDSATPDDHRDKVQPKNWNVPRLVEWLYEHAPTED